MGPKKDAKKGGGGDFELDPTQYVREAAELPAPAEEVPALQEPLKAVLANIEKVLPVWNIEGENWSEPIDPDGAFVIEYPEHILVNEGKALRAYLDLDADEAAADPKAKGKKDAKKGAPASELTEPAVDEETGKTLPRMFLENTNAVMETIEPTGFDMPWTFFKRLSAEQKSRKAEYDRMNDEITAAQAAVESAEEGSGEGQKDDLAKKAAALQDSYAEAMESNDVHKEEPAGGLVDPLMVTALQLIGRFGRAIVQSSKCEGSSEEGAPFGMQYLWRSIYPKLPGSNRPCYNPAGKYGVRLFLGGEWRLVKVTDEVPLDSDGDRAIACSSNPLELWPMILAKAVYHTYTKCGYKATLGAPLDGESSSTKSVAVFTAFAVHVLTGWLPGTPMNLSGMMDDDSSRVKVLRDEILFGGALFVDPTQIPESLQELLDSENKPAAPKDGQSGSPQPVNGLRTKKQFKEEYQRKQSEREQLINALKRREGMIVAIEDGVTSTAFSDAFFATFWNGASTQVLPILGVSYAKTSDENAVEDMASTRLLVHWEVIKKIPTEEVAIDVSTLSAIERHKAQLPKLPEPTEVNMQWISLEELKAANGYITSLDSRLRTPVSTPLPRHWLAEEPIEDGGGKGKGKDKKGKGDAPESDSGANALCVEQGELPPTLLKVANTAFFKAEEATPVVENAVVDDAEAAAAIADQAEEMEKVASTATLVPIAPSLSLSVAIHADMLVSTSATDEGSAASGEAEGGDTSVAAASGALPPQLPSGVVVVLQEVRTDDEDPLVMRVELTQTSAIPITRTTFHIPSARLSTSDKEPLLFWVRVFTKASFVATFSCGVDISVGPAETIWESCGNGYSALVKEGEALPTADDTEQIVFRYPLRLDASEGDDSYRVEKALCCVHIPTISVSEHLSCSTHSDQKVNADEKEHANEVVTEDGKTVYDIKSDLLESSNFDSSVSFPKISLSAVPVNSSCNTTLILHCKMNKFLQECRGNSATEVPAFPWKLVVLAKSAIATPANLQTNNQPCRYVGAYYPNRDLSLFRDVLSVQKTSFPISLSIGCQKGADKSNKEEVTEASDEGEAASDAVSSAAKEAIEKFLGPGIHSDEFAQKLAYVLTVSRKSDRRKVYELRGQGGIHVLNICIDGFLQPGEEVPTRSTEEAPPADAKGKKDDKKGKGGGGAVDDVVDLLVELRLDESAMFIPDEWRSRLPYAFTTTLGGLDDPDPKAVDRIFDEKRESAKAAVADGSNLDALPYHAIELVKPQFLWKYDVLTGTVASVSHDYEQILRINKLKKEWDSMAAGRGELSRLAATYFNHVAHLSSTAEGENRVHFDDKIIETLDSAIWSKKIGAAERLQIMHGHGVGNNFKENYTGSGLDVVHVEHAGVVQRREKCDLEIEKLQNEAVQGVELMFKFNERVREQTKLRIFEVIDSAYSAEEPAVAEEKGADADQSASSKAKPGSIAAWWEKREKYRNDTDVLNQSLRILLDRAKDAIEATDPNADPKKKKK